MKSRLSAVLLWIAVFVATYVAMILLNSVGAAIHGQGPSYGSSRLQQEITGFTRLFIHLAPAVAVAYWRPARAWVVCGVMSLIAEAVNAFLHFSPAPGDIPYVGGPLAEMVTYVLVGVFAAAAIASCRVASKSTSLQNHAR